MDRSRHAKLDWALCAGLAAVALGSRRMMPAAAACGVAGMAVATDYEGGAVPALSLGAHRAIEAASGLVWLAVGLRGRERVLAAAGLAQLALASTPVARGDGPPDPAYRPLGTPKRFAEDVWVVDDLLHGVVPVRMTILRLPSGELLLHSPTRHSPALQRALEAIGPVRHLVAPSIAHWMFVRAWQEAVPEAVTWAAPRLRERGQVRRAGLRIDHVLGDSAPDAWGGVIEPVLVRGRLGFREVALFHRPSRTALLTDLVQNFEREKLAWPLRPLARLAGNMAPSSRAPAYLRAIVGRRDAAAARRIVAWTPARLLVTHGRPITEDAAGVLRRSLAWLTG